VILGDPSVKRVALVRLRVGLGDLLCTLPAVRALRRFRPDLEIALVTWPETAPVVSRMRPYVDQLVDFPGVTGIPERTPDRAAWPRFVQEAHARKFDVAVQCYGESSVANEVATAMGPAHTAGFAPDGWIPSADERLHLPYPTDVHEIWRHLKLVETLGVPVDARDAALEFPVTSEENHHLESILSRHGLRRGRYAVLHPGASAASRQWPTERYAAVADEVADMGLEVVLTGTAAERPLTSRVGERMTRPAADLTGRTTLGVLAALLRDSAVLIGNDTGTAHLAAAVRAASVTIFLSGDPIRWAHPDARHRAVWVDVGCNPCPHLLCPIGHPCAEAITPTDVLAEVDRAMRPGSRTSSRP
jgi:ADP-heptose:LPS heptosyltransferase